MPEYLLAAGLANSGKLPPGLLFALVPLLVLIVALDVYCLIDLARAKPVRYLPKIVWVIVILVASARWTCSTERTTCRTTCRPSR
jgi:hypothetical protein